MITKVITLPQAKDRQNQIDLSFGLKNIPFQYFFGVESNDFLFTKDETFYFKNKPFKIHSAKLYDYTLRFYILIGEIANVFAHYCLWNELKKDSNNDVYLICEDDCTPSDNFNINNLMDVDYSDIDCLYLQAPPTKESEKRIQSIVEGLENFKLTSELKIVPPDLIFKDHKTFYNFICVGTGAYCITKRGAQKLCDYIENIGYDGPMDNFISRMQNFNLIYPTKIKNFFCLNEMAKYSYIQNTVFPESSETHVLEILSSVGKIEIRSRKELQIKD